MKQLFNPEDIERKVLLILKILNEDSNSKGKRVIARKMKIIHKTAMIQPKLMVRKVTTLPAQILPASPKLPMLCWPMV